MITKELLIDFAFKGSIFGLLIYKIYDLGKQYFLPYLNKQIASRDTENNNFLEKEKLIASTRLRLENQIYRQKQMFVTLENNVQRWHNFMLAFHNQQDSLLRQRTQQLHEKRTRQQQHVITQHNVHLALPAALTAANDELTHKYAGEAGKLFLKKILGEVMIKKHLP